MLSITAKSMALLAAMALALPIHAASDSDLESQLQGYCESLDEGMETIRNDLPLVIHDRMTLENMEASINGQQCQMRYHYVLNTELLLADIIEKNPSMSAKQAMTFLRTEGQEWVENTISGSWFDDLGAKIQEEPLLRRIAEIRFSEGGVPTLEIDF